MVWHYGWRPGVKRAAPRSHRVRAMRGLMGKGNAQLGQLQLGSWRHTYTAHRQRRQTQRKSFRRFLCLTSDLAAWPRRGGAGRRRYPHVCAGAGLHSQSQRTASWWPGPVLRGLGRIHIVVPCSLNYSLNEVRGIGYSYRKSKFRHFPDKVSTFYHCLRNCGHQLTTTDG